jgi:hypothetical protein
MFNSLSQFYNPLVIFVSWQTIPVHETSRPSLQHRTTFISVSKSTVQDKVRNKIYFFSFKITITSCSCRWGETMSLNCGHQRVQWRCNPGGMMLTAENRKAQRKICPSAT